MATILLIRGWRIFFYSNEGNEPAHIHCRKAEKECKYWLNDGKFDINLAYDYGMSPQAHKEVRKIIFQNFDYIIEEWDKVHNKKG